MPDLQGTLRRALLHAERGAASKVHTARLRPACWELVRRATVWEELERRDATAAIVPFSRQAGRSGRTDVIQLLRREGETLVDVERWTGREELCHAPEAPVWERFGRFNRHPLVRGEVIWSAEDRTVVIRGRRGDRRFEEIVVGERAMGSSRTSGVSAGQSPLFSLVDHS